MIEKKAIIRNEMGIHCRPSARIVTEAIRQKCDIKVICDAGEADLRSLLSLVSLGLQEGTEIVIQVAGEEESSVCDYFVELFETHFDFPPQLPASRTAMLKSLVDP